MIFIRTSPKPCYSTNSPVLVPSCRSECVEIWSHDDHSVMPMWTFNNQPMVSKRCSVIAGSSRYTCLLRFSSWTCVGYNELRCSSWSCITYHVVPTWSSVTKIWSRQCLHQELGQEHRQQISVRHILSIRQYFILQGKLSNSCACLLQLSNFSGAVFLDYDRWE